MTVTQAEKDTMVAAADSLTKDVEAVQALVAALHAKCVGMAEEMEAVVVA